MSDDSWAEASSRLTSAVDFALEVGILKEEILDIVTDACPSDTPHVGGGPKRSKKLPALDDHPGYDGDK